MNARPESLEQQQHDWALTYRQELLVADTTGRKVSRRGQDALGRLTLSCVPKLENLIRSRLGGHPGSVEYLVETVVGDVMPLLLTQAQRYQPEICTSFSNWVTRLGGPVDLQVKDLVARPALYAQLNKIERQVLRSWYATAAELRDEMGASPTDEQVFRQLLANYGGETAATTVDEITDAKLTRSGAAKALRNIAELRNAENAVKGAYTADIGDNVGWEEIPAPRVGAAAAAEFEALARIADGDTELPTIAAADAVIEAGISCRKAKDAYGAEVSDIRRHTVTAAARLQSAHAQYAYLAGDIRAQFTHADRLLVAA